MHNGTVSAIIPTRFIFQPRAMIIKIRHVNAETMATAVSAIQQGASLAHAVQQQPIRYYSDMIQLQDAFDRQRNSRISADTLAVAVSAIQQGDSVAHAAQQHGIRHWSDMIRIEAAFNRSR